MFSDVIGHEEVLEKLKNALRSDRIANAYIFSGPDSVGKELVAMNFTKALNCLINREDPCDKCISCRKIDDENHADVMVIRPEGTRLKIDQMRSLQRQGSYRAMEGNYKVYIIAEAEKMTAEAANSILKTLEEPPGVMVLILLTSYYNALLPTIRSRCQSLKFYPVPTTLLSEELVKRYGVPKSKAKWIAIRSQGKVGEALRLIEKKEEDQDELSASFPDLRMKNANSLLSIFRKVENLSESEDSLNIILSWYRDLLLAKYGCSQHLLVHSDKKSALEVTARSYSDDQIEKLIKGIMRTQNLIKKNVNSTLAMEVMMLRSFDILSTRL
jgi:DNA polymerase-3 subunit delta'